MQQTQVCEKSFCEVDEVKTALSAAVYSNSEWVIALPTMEWQTRLCARVGITCNMFHQLELQLPGVKNGMYSVTMDAKPRQVRDMKRDGNCMWRWLSFAVSGTEEHHLQFRNCVIQFMLQHWNTYSDAAVQTFCRLKGMNIAQTRTYVEKGKFTASTYLQLTGVDKEGTFCYGAELNAAADYLQNPIACWSTLITPPRWVLYGNNYRHFNNYLVPQILGFNHNFDHFKYVSFVKKSMSSAPATPDSSL